MKELLVIGEQSFPADFLVQEFAKSGFKVLREFAVNKTLPNLINAAERIMILWGGAHGKKNRVPNVRSELKKMLFCLNKYRREKNARILVLAPAAYDRSLLPEESAECAALETEIKVAGHAFATSGNTLNLLRIEPEILKTNPDGGVEYKAVLLQIFEAAKHMLTNSTIYINGTALDY